MTNDKMQQEKTFERLCLSLQQVEGDIDRVQKESTKIQDKGKQTSNKCLFQDSSSAKHILLIKNNMVGRDDERETSLEDLARVFFGEPEVIMIVRMGCIGKTKVGKEVFNDLSTRSHFDVFAWNTMLSKSKQWESNIVDHPFLN